MLTVSYSVLLANLAGDAGKFGDDVMPADRKQLTYYLNEAVRWAWKDYSLGWVHPDCVTSGELTVTDSGVAAELIDESLDWVTVWTADPRTNKKARRVPHERDADGIWLTESDPPATVYVFWRKPLPVFTVEDEESVVIPSSLEPAVRYFARWKWLASKDLNSNAAAIYKAARDTIDDLIDRTTPLPFWLTDGGSDR